MNMKVKLTWDRRIKQTLQTYLAASEDVVYNLEDVNMACILQGFEERMD